MDDNFILHLIRHAPTAGNKAKQYIGWTDEPALPFQPLPDLTIENVWGSDLLRCRQTAAAIFPNATYHADSGFRECHFGLWEKKTYAELETDLHYRNWIAEPWQVTPPKGESLLDLSHRVERAVKALPQGQEFIIVTHGGPIRYLMARAFGKDFQEQRVMHGYCHSIVWQNRHAFEEGEVCKSFSVEPIMGKESL